MSHELNEPLYSSFDKQRIFRAFYHSKQNKQNIDS